jgi:hypothetical protein
LKVNHSIAEMSQNMHTNEDQTISIWLVDISFDIVTVMSKTTLTVVLNTEIKDKAPNHNLSTQNKW